MTLPIVALALGDQAGIGPEIALKAAQDPRVLAVCRPVLVGDRGALGWHAQSCGIAADIATIDAFSEAGTTGTSSACSRATLKSTCPRGPLPH